MNFPSANTDSIELSNDFKQNFKQVLSIDIANYGAVAVILNVNGVKRTLPAGNTFLNVPNYSFRYTCEGVPFDIEIELLFPNGSSRVIIDKSTLKNC